MRALMMLLVLGACAPAGEANWPQFRGPGGLCIGSGTPPIEFGPEKNCRWKVEVPRGHSSPCIWGDRIVLTGLDNGKLLTFCLDRNDGHELWRTGVPADKIERTHQIGSPAASTPCTDGERIYAYFGSYGLVAYDLAGTVVWTRPLPAPMVEFGTGASPILAGGKVILVCDQDLGSYLLAVDAATGKDAWRADRAEFRRSFSSPFLWRHDGTEEIIVAGSIVVRSYDVADGHERWSSRGMARVSNASPTAGEGMLIVSSWNVGGDEGAKITMASFDEFLAAHDRNHDGVLSRDEFPPGPLKDRFSQIDLDKDGRVTRAEWDHMRAMFDDARNQIFALRPGGSGDITASNLLWSSSKHLPYVSSPLCYQGHVYTMQSGGMFSCYDAATGKVFYQAQRVDAGGDYYSSAVGADGRVYIASQNGVVVVLAAGEAFTVLARNKVDEQVFATPAILDGSIYLRGESHLFSFAP